MAFESFLWYISKTAFVCTCLCQSSWFHLIFYNFFCVFFFFLQLTWRIFHSVMPLMMLCADVKQAMSAEKNPAKSVCQCHWPPNSLWQPFPFTSTAQVGYSFRSFSTKFAALLWKHLLHCSVCTRWALWLGVCVCVFCVRVIVKQRKWKSTDKDQERSMLHLLCHLLLLLWVFRITLQHHTWLCKWWLLHSNHI